MRGTVAKRLRKLGLRAGPRKRLQKPLRAIEGWHRTTALIPNPVIEELAEAKRRRRRLRNLRLKEQGAFGWA
jgi:hypothetical protein